MSFPGATENHADDPPPPTDPSRQFRVDFNKLRSEFLQQFAEVTKLPFYSTEWETKYQTAFAAFDTVWNFQYLHRNEMDMNDDCRVRKIERADLATKIGQLLYQYYLRTSNSRYLLDSCGVYSVIEQRDYFGDVPMYVKSPVEIEKKFRFHFRYLVAAFLLDDLDTVSRNLTNISQLLAVAEPDLQNTFKQWKQAELEVHEFLRVAVDVCGWTSWSLGRINPMKSFQAGLTPISHGGQCHRIILNSISTQNSIFQIHKPTTLFYPSELPQSVHNAIQQYSIQLSPSQADILKSEIHTNRFLTQMERDTIKLQLNTIAGQKKGTLLTFANGTCIVCLPSSDPQIQIMVRSFQYFTSDSQIPSNTKDDLFVSPFPFHLVAHTVSYNRHVVFPPVPSCYLVEYGQPRLQLQDAVIVDGGQVCARRTRVSLSRISLNALRMREALETKIWETGECEFDKKNDISPNQSHNSLVPPTTGFVHVQAPQPTLSTTPASVPVVHSNVPNTPASLQQPSVVSDNMSPQFWSQTGTSAFPHTNHPQEFISSSLNNLPSERLNYELLEGESHSFGNTSANTSGFHTSAIDQSPSPLSSAQNSKDDEFRDAGLLGSTYTRTTPFLMENTDRRKMEERREEEGPKPLQGLFHTQSFSSHRSKTIQDGNGNVIVASPHTSVLSHPPFQSLLSTLSSSSLQQPSKNALLIYVSADSNIDWVGLSSSPSLVSSHTPTQRRDSASRASPTHLNSPFSSPPEQQNAKVDPENPQLLLFDVCVPSDQKERLFSPFGSSQTETFTAPNPIKHKAVSFGKPDSEEQDSTEPSNERDSGVSVLHQTEADTPSQTPDPLLPTHSPALSVRSVHSIDLNTLTTPPTKTKLLNNVIVASPTLLGNRPSNILPNTPTLTRSIKEATATSLDPPLQAQFQPSATSDLFPVLSVHLPSSPTNQTTRSSNETRLLDLSASQPAFLHSTSQPDFIRSNSQPDLDNRSESATDTDWDAAGANLALGVSPSPAPDLTESPNENKMIPLMQTWNGVPWMGGDGEVGRRRGRSVGGDEDRQNSHKDESQSPESIPTISQLPPPNMSESSDASSLNRMREAELEWSDQPSVKLFKLEAQPATRLTQAGSLVPFSHIIEAEFGVGGERGRDGERSGVAIFAPTVRDESGGQESTQSDQHNSLSSLHTPNYSHHTSTHSGQLAEDDNPPPSHSIHAAIDYMAFDRDFEVERIPAPFQPDMGLADQIRFSPAPTFQSRDTFSTIQQTLGGGGFGHDADGDVASSVVPSVFETHNTIQPGEANHTLPSASVSNNLSYFSSANDPFRAVSLTPVFTPASTTTKHENFIRIPLSGLQPIAASPLSLNFEQNRARSHRSITFSGSTTKPLPTVPTTQTPPPQNTLRMRSQHSKTAKYSPFSFLSSLPSPMSNNLSALLPLAWDQNTITPLDLVPFTHKSLVVIVDSDVSTAFNVLADHNSGFPSSLLLLLSPTQPLFVPCRELIHLATLTIPNCPSFDLAEEEDTHTHTHSHLVPLVPPSTSIGQLYTIALTDPILAIFLLGYPFRAHLQNEEHQQKMREEMGRDERGAEKEVYSEDDEGSVYPLHPSHIPVTLFCSQLSPNNCSCSAHIPNVVQHKSTFANTTPNNKRTPTPLVSNQHTLDSLLAQHAFCPLNTLLFRQGQPMTHVRVLKCRELLDRMVGVLTTLFIHSRHHFCSQSFISSTLASLSLPSAVSPLPLSILHLAEDPFVFQFIFNHSLFTAALRLHKSFREAPDECFPTINPVLPEWWGRMPLWGELVGTISNALGCEKVFL
ncbi:putative Protein SCAI [Blattamonas nauphoetae]|uniref:Mediator of RNA polymerase II transcription subunit 13 n=1 Tax=Blattamonas nauphoetae TaxID=2049346 RepID=A0ABQ9Y3Y1_9EUKA|nr:putative Protein SCAI [Blattamonas nauphoetae]